MNFFSPFHRGVLVLTLLLAAGCSSSGPASTAQPSPKSPAGRAALADSLLRQSLTAPAIEQRIAAILAAADKPADDNLAAAMQAIDQAENVVTYNLANARTIGYRAAQVQFTGNPVYSQFTLNMEQGELESTNRLLDVAIEGQGFFRVKITPGVSDGYAYTRAGNFFVNKDQQLVLGRGDGYRLDPAITIPPTATNVTISDDGVVDYLVPGQVSRQRAGTIKLVNFVNPNGLTLLGGSIYLETESSGQSITATPGEDGLGTLQQSYLEGSNVDARKETLRLARLREWRQDLQSAIDMIVSRVRGNTSPVGMWHNNPRAIPRLDR
ncbi:MAG: flagellar hook basal-body protein [Tepidisphaeraceae bacterium]|jgi:flagellar basal body rod protein FlgG